jgi:hopanoid-associated phosphorylase
VREIGIITAMRVEARCITSLRLPFNERISLGESAAIWLCGMGEKAARDAAEGLRKSGADALMSFGFAGALDSSLRPGHLILPEFVHAGHSLQVDLSWRDSLRRCLPDHLNVTGGVLAASRKMVTSAIAKRELAGTTGACAVDMESGAVAEAAAHAGLPFLAIRAISDPVDFSPPQVLLDAVRPDGSTDLTRLLPLLMRRSLAVGTLIRLAMGSRAACATLSAVVRYANAEMGMKTRNATSTRGYVSGRTG